MPGFYDFKLMKDLLSSTHSSAGDTKLTSIKELIQEYLSLETFSLNRPYGSVMEK